MIRLFLPLLLSLTLVRCATYEIPNLKPHVTLPASGDGYSVETLTGQWKRIPESEWNEKRKRGIVLFSEDWQKLKFTLLKNCMTNKCKQTAGALDDLFLKIDDALRQIKLKKK